MACATRGRVTAELTRFERMAVALGRFTNERPGAKRWQGHWLRTMSWWWIRPVLTRRMYAEGLDELRDLTPERGILVVSNHRSFFDQYAIMLATWAAKMPWSRDLYFPVRANFFYERPLGLFVNYFVGGGAMYPPIFRQRERAELNDDALDRIIKFFDRPGAVVGVHPEGTRGKGPDPYQFLKAQPGVGKIALLARPTVIPVFINGLSNDLVADIRANFAPDIRRTRPCIGVYGRPIDLSDLYAQKPRPALYKKTADRFMAEIGKLAARERELREACLAGRIADDDPHWVIHKPIDRLYAHL
jgi:1-acyl-sn-glycerol-3-phosphate acyltransferase